MYDSSPMGLVPDFFVMHSHRTSEVMCELEWSHHLAFNKQS